MKNNKNIKSKELQSWNSHVWFKGIKWNKNERKDVENMEKEVNDLMWFQGGQNLTKCTQMYHTWPWAYDTS